MPSSKLCSTQSTRSVAAAFSTFRKKSAKKPQPLTKAQLALFNANMGLVHHVAHRFEWHGEDYEDMAQIGSIGLMVASQKFQSGKGFAFSSYAIRCITGEIMHHLRDHGSSVKVPRKWREDKSKAGKIAKACAAQGMSLEATVLKICEELGILREEWMRIEEAHTNQYHSSLEEVVVGEEESEEPTTPGDTPEIAWAKIRARISHLPKPEYTIAEMLVRGSTHEQIARKLEMGMPEFNRRLQTVRLSLSERRA